MSQLRRILPYYRPYRGQVAVGMALVVVAQGFALVSPWLIKLAIDALADPAGSRAPVTRYACSWSAPP